MKKFKEYLDEASSMIASAVQRGNAVYTYDEKGRQIGIISAGSGIMVSFTPTSVSIKKSKQIYIYDQKGRQLSVVIG
jgi:hypothetical protein